MVKHTDRDKIWNVALELALQADPDNPSEIDKSGFKLKHVKNRFSEPPSDRTVRDVLNTMCFQGWLSKDQKQSHSWYAGTAFKDMKFRVMSSSLGIAHNVPDKPNDDDDDYEKYWYVDEPEKL